MQVTWVLSAIFITSLLGIFFHNSLFLLLIGSFLSLIYSIVRQKKKGFNPKSDNYKEIEKLKKKRTKIENYKHQHINDQMEYIAKMWGYTKKQEKIIKKFIVQRAYTRIYNKLTAALLPQMIILIDNCNAKKQKGCTREVSKCLRELTDIMQLELKKKKYKNNEDFSTSLEVYNQLFLELK